MKINTNIASLQANTNLMRTNRKISLSMERMSSGLKINSVADNPAGLAISNKLRSQIRGLNVASQNALDGVSMMQTADGALDEVNSIVQRMRELAVQASNDSNTADDRTKMQIEIEQLVAEIDGIVDRTEFNDKKILNGELSRLVENKLGVNSGDSIFKTLFLSSNVPSGTFSYHIEQLGTPAKVEGNISSSSSFTDSEFTINGETVNILATDTPEEVLAKIREAAALSDIEVKAPDYPNSGPLIFISKKDGSKASITFGPANSNALTTLGLSPGTTTGNDAVISNLSFKDSTNQSSAIFGNDSTISYDGNRVIVTGSDGKTIDIELQVKVLDDGTYELGNGTTVNDDGTITSGPITDLNMEITDLGGLKLQVGPDENMNVLIDIPKISAEFLGLDSVNYKTREGAQAALESCDFALSQLSSIRSKLGSFQNRLEYNINSLNVATINTEASKSRILDTDMAQEMTTYTQMNIISQAGISILAQANQRPQQLLQLLN